MPIQLLNNITDKTYRKLILKVADNGFSYAVADTLANRIKQVGIVGFGEYPKSNKVEENYWKAFIDNSPLTRTYDSVQVLHENSLNTFVPKPLFDEEFAGSYLQYNTKVFESDFFASDTLENDDVVNVYIPYVNINNFLIDQFGPFEYRHYSSILVAKLLDITKNNEQAQMFVHFGSGTFEIIVARNKRLLLFNSFEFQTPADFVYYLLFTAEQLGLNPEYFPLQLLGEVTQDSPFFQLAYKYVRNISMLEIPLSLLTADASAEQVRRHFILYNS